jgi:hypothetical protein
VGGSNSYTYAQVQLYLSNAYYEIVSDIRLASNIFVGLGGASVTSGSSAMAFSGTIFGRWMDDEGRYPQITISLTGTASQFGGLIKYSQGSVVKDLNLVYDGSLSVTCSAVPGNSSSQVGGSFFGGVVGYCLGGDTILENVSVSGLNVDVSGTYDYLAAVGGYVGLVGGYAETNGLESKGGGVILRSITAQGLSDEKSSAGSGYFYCNPYVGRVLDGYAAAEETSVDNTDKNYTIPLLVKTDTKLEAVREAASSASQWAVTVTDAQSLWVLSAIVNSGAGNMDWYGNYRVCGSTISNAYHYGKVRSGTDADSNAADEQWWGGQRTVNTSSANRNLSRVCYLISNGYAAQDASRIAAYPMSDSYSLTFTGESYDMTVYGNGFRGVGGSYSTWSGSDSDYWRLAKNRTSRTLSLNSLDGGNAVITLHMDRKVYAAEEKGMGSLWTLVGVGLFPVLNVTRNSAVTIQDLTLSGVVMETVYDGTTGNTTPSTTPAAALGGLGGLMANQYNDKAQTLTFQNITVKGLTVSGGQVAGGILGSDGYNLGGQNSVHSLVFQDCVFQNDKSASLSITAAVAAGGFVGGMYATSNNGSFTVLYSGGETPTFSGTVTAGNYSGASGQGVGGLVGVLNGSGKTISVNAAGNVTMVMEDVTVQSVGTANTGAYSVGGLIGLCTGGTNTINISFVQLNNMTVRGFDTDADSWRASNRYVGGVIGSLAGTTATTLNSIQIVPDAKQQVQITNGRMCGGLVGYITSSGSLTVTDYELRGSGVDNRNIIIYDNGNTNESYVGGVLGSVTSGHTITVKQSVLENAVMAAQGKAFCAAVVGCLGNGTAVALNISDSIMRSCVVVGDNTNSHLGLLAGRVPYSNGAVNGYDLLAEDNLVGRLISGSNYGTFSKGQSMSFDAGNVGLEGKSYSSIYSNQTVSSGSYRTSYVGQWVGSVNNVNCVHLVGVRVTGLYRPNYDVYNWTVGSQISGYIIYANHEGTSEGDDFVTTDITTQPTVTAAGITLSGDGAVPDGGSGTPVEKILAEYAANKEKHWNLMYGTAAEALAKFSKGGTYASTLTTYDTAGENDTVLGEDDFSVLEINTTSATSVTAIVNSYIGMVTNRTETAASHAYASIEVTTYQWKDGAFTSEGVTPSLVWDGASGLLRVNNGAYDNTNDQFTMLTVKYKNPTKSSATEDDSYFVLNIPVLVKKMMRFTFHAAVQSGTDYYAQDYSSLRNHVMASHGEQITAFLSFDFFDRSSEEWQAAVDNGEDLLWNFDMLVSVGTTALPDGTRLTLVDKNRGGLAYTLTVGSGTFSTVDAGSGQSYYLLDLTKFRSITNTQQAWDSKLCDYLSLTAEESTAGAYVRAADTSEATLRVDGVYYRPATTADAGTRYTITVGLGTAEHVSEDFYLTIQTPEDTDIIVNNTITYPYNQLFNGSIPTQRSYNGQNGLNVKNSEENIYILGNFLTQTLSVRTTTSFDQMSTENNTITADLTAHIAFSGSAAAEVYTAYATKLELYQSFVLTLREYDGAGEYAPANLASKATVSVSYQIKHGDVTEDGPEGEDVLGTQLTGVDIKDYVQQYGAEGFDLIAHVEISYPDGDALVMQFPEREGSDEVSGISLLGTSYIAYSRSASELAASSMRVGPLEDGINVHYYRGDVSDARLSYMALDYDYGTGTGDESSLGINANDLIFDPPVPLSTVAYYDVSNLSNATQARKIHCELQLWQKNENGIYEQVSAGKYISGVTGYVNNSVSAKAAGNVFVWEDTWSAVTNDLADTAINVDFSVKTGSAFERAGYDYANYRVVLAVSLLDENGDVLDGSETNDYIIYTNARIYTSILPQ